MALKRLLMLAISSAALTLTGCPGDDSAAATSSGSTGTNDDSTGGSAPTITTTNPTGGVVTGGADSSTGSPTTGNPTTGNPTTTDPGTSSGGGMGGDCCAAHATPGCDDMTCQDAVCAEDQFCCAFEWDMGCADIAAMECAGCGGMATGSGTDSGGATCGNGMIDGGEDCDGADLNGGDCAGLGFDGGMLACDGTCQYDTSGCMGGAVMCDAGAIMGCTDEDPAACVCEACDPGGGCQGSEDCVCPDCANDGFCSNPANCNNDGLCDPYLEGCVCGDCAGHPSCPAPGVCGDGMVSGGEACDGADLNGADCTTLGFMGGVLACDGMCGFDTSGCMGQGFCDVAAISGCTDEDPVACTCEACDPGGGCQGSEDCTCPDCAADVFCGDAANCNNDGLCDPYLEGCVCADCAAHPLCGAPAVCGDGMIEGAEQCEGADLNGADCTTLGFMGGMLACDAGCAFDTSGCMAGPLMCDAGAISGCTDEDPATCTCEACDPGGGCQGSEDCTCPDCAADEFCANPANCNNDGLCSPYFEGCVCPDCASHPLCP